jgi:hypothetical protein
MADEIECFVTKFKSLCASGHQARLTLNSRKGQVWVNLHVGLRCPQPHQGGGANHHGPGHSNARQRRNIRRAATVTEEVTEAATNEDQVGERKEEAVEDSANPNIDEAEEVSSEEMVTADVTEKGTANDIPTVEPETLKDEFCSNESYEIVSDDQLVEKTLVTADCQADWSDKVVTKLMDEKLNAIGIKMKSVKVNRNIRKCFESCLVTINPMQRKLIDQESFPLRRWTMKCII